MSTENTETVDIIDRVPYWLAERLESDPFFQDVVVVVAEEGNILQQIAEKQAVVTTKSGKRGVAVIVLQMVADDERPNIQFGPMTLRPAIQVVENLELNRDENGTGKSARKVARKVVVSLKNFGMQGFFKAMMPDKPCIEPINLQKELGDLVKAYQVNFRCLEIPDGAQGQVEMPQFVNLEPAAQFALTCPTEGAEIFYTLDGTYPRAGNPSAVGYAAGSPISIPDGGVVVMACAYRDGWNASWVNRAAIVSR